MMIDIGLETSHQCQQYTNLHFPSLVMRLEAFGVADAHIALVYKLCCVRLSYQLKLYI